MKKHTLLLGVLGLSVLETHSGVMSSKSHVRFTEEELDKVEKALEANDVSGLNQTIADQKEKISTHEKSEGELKESLTAAFAANKLEMGDMSPKDAIAHLSAKCKEYGDARNTHSITRTDGIDKNEGDGLVDGFIDPNAAHNQALTQNKFKPLK
ncbi:hypothetical protein [Chryseobacterium indologenes]|uniref:hypothetical protein n=1 Tax=Chryseobacterium indologenes TaxID=253 RepID=UPI0016255594|nr:hypothetical protein [Chryseobacterium indologenes]